MDPDVFRRISPKWFEKMSEDTTNVSDDKSNDDTNEIKKAKPHYTLSTENWEHQHEKKEKEQDPFTFPTSPKQRKAFGARLSSTRTPSHLSREKLSTIKNKLRQQTYTGTGRDVQQLFEHFDTNHDGTLRSFLRRSL